MLCDIRGRALARRFLGTLPEAHAPRGTTPPAGNGMIGTEERPKLGQAVRRSAIILGSVLALAPAAALAQATNQPTITSPASANSAALSQLFWIIFWMAVVVFLLVEGLILFAALRFRRRDTDGVPPQFTHSNRAEVLWTAAPVIVVLALAVISQQKIMAAYNPPADAYEIEVIGKQWFWKYVYPEAVDGGREGDKVTTATELVVPVGRPVRLNLKSDDVIHSFWVPQLAGKQDAEPGWRYGGWKQPFIWFVADKAGVFEGQCAELCGTQHAGMRLRVIAKPEAEFQAWLANQRRPAREPAAGSAEARGLALISDPQNKCLACHQIHGVKNMLGQTGPNLTHMASRELLAGGVFTNTPANLHQWIKNPDSLKFGSKMILTGVNLTDAQIDDIVAYLRSLE